MSQQKEQTYFIHLKKIWEGFTASFKNEITKASYQSDVIEFLDFTEKDFTEITDNDVKQYFEYLQKKVFEKNLAPSTMAKKIRELNSLSNYILENRQYLEISESYQNHFSAYTKLVEERSKQANSVPVEDIDKLLIAAKEDYQAYCIITLLYRIGLSSTEIIKLKLKDMNIYENGAYLNVPGRRKAVYVPEDVYKIMNLYLQYRSDESEYFFFNSRGNALNAMYISRMMKKYTLKAGIHGYSAESLRNSCIYTMASYRLNDAEIAEEMNITEGPVKRYRNINYIDDQSRGIRNMVKIKVELPED